MNTKKTLFVIISSTLLTGLLLIPFFTKSAHAWDGGATGKVGGIYVGGTGGAYFDLEGRPELCASAGSDNRVGLLYSPPDTASMTDREGSKAMLALLTSAKLSGKTVKVYAMNGINWGCIVGGIEFP